MIYISEDNNDRRIRIWVNELPIKYKANKVISLSCDYVSSDAIVASSVAVEIKNGRLSNNNYAMIGGEFQINNTGRFQVNLSIPYNMNKKYITDMSSSNDNVYIGFDEQYSIAIMGCDHSENRLPSGILTINCAACAEIGSSIKCFKWAYRVLLNTLCKKQILFDDKELFLLYK
ncbi:MAG: hypothetical protein IJ366_09105 [Clostridia bacterium]|nr:hypothetical protein [Clostridia bacterium]